MLKKNALEQVSELEVPGSLPLLAWYDRHGRDLPWRRVTGEHRDYKVWLSEIMLQQTTIVTGTPYYHKFLQRWPTLADLAGASLDDVLQEWAGLGYYARARNLHKCADLVMKNYDGRFPLREEQLLTLPGIGPYTAAAMAAILGGHPSVVVDGNVERVITRLYTIDVPLPQSKVQIKQLAAELTPHQRPGDYAQGLMDLGAMICTPRNPKCDLCPWHLSCRAYRTQTQEDYPKKVKKGSKPKRQGIVFFIENQQGEILLTKRPDRGIFASMWAFPGTKWDDKHATHAPNKPEIDSALPGEISGGKTGHYVRHVFTHFDLELEIWAGKVEELMISDKMRWVEREKVLDVGLPSVMKKVATLML